MNNKITGLASKVLMGILFLVGIILIWSNLSYDTGAEEPILNQSFYSITYDTEGLKNKKTDDKTVVFYDFVLDEDNNKVVYDLSNNQLYDRAEFEASQGMTKTKKGEFKNDEVDAVLLDQYQLQSATISSVNYTWYLMWGGLFLIGIFTVWNVVQNPKRFIRPTIGVVILAALTGICYAMVETATTRKIALSDNYSDQAYQYSGMGISLFLTLTVIAVGLIVLGAIMGALRYFSK